MMTPRQKKTKRLKPKTVYIVDDDEDLAIVLREHLHLNGYLTKTCTSQFESLLHEDAWNNVDVLLLDLWLADGGVSAHFPLAMKILKYVSQRHPHVRRIVYTAFDERVVGIIIKQSIQGMSDVFLTKPTPIRVILEEIEKR